ncbi:MAG: TIGR00730 family Rossman fold protein [Chitinophagales bacterium]|nr:TIGR00730 family Rossman fold protein [Chitinophagales bacterium]
MKQKKWSNKNHHADSSWRMFKIMAEFADGFDRMEQFGPCISIFGSARTKADNPYYKLTEKIAEKLAKEGYGVITGGGPGVMEAGNKGAKKGKGKSVGLHIILPHEEGANQYVDHNKIFMFRYFFARKVMFIKYAQAFVYIPGGFGTMDELFEVLTLVQTKKIQPVPIVLIGKSYWSGLLDWIKTTMLEKEHNINPADLNLFHVTDDPDEVVKIIKSHYKKADLKPNFE